MHYERHAIEVVTRFRKMLDDEVVEQISIEHFQELETLIAAALGVVDSQARKEIADRFAALLKLIYKEAGQVDTDYLADLKEPE